MAEPESKWRRIGRRAFLIGSAAVAGGVAFGVWYVRAPHDNPLEQDLAEGEAALTPYVRIDGDGVTIIVPRAEMGQGVRTTLAALVAEELDIALADIRVEHGPPSPAYYNGALLGEGVPYASTNQGWFAEGSRALMAIPAKVFGIQVTGGSSSVPDAFEKMRKAGAAARVALVEAAARALGQETAALRTEDGAVVAPDGQRLTYAELAVTAAEIGVPSDPPLKPQSQWQILGNSQPRIDMPAKCTGTAEFGIDVRLPEMLHATVRMNPNLGGPLLGLDSEAAEGRADVEAVVPLPGGVAVVASNTWSAFQGAAALKPRWGEAGYPLDLEAHFDAVAAAFDGEEDSRYTDDGDVDAAFAGAGEGEVISAEYRAPYLAHATMEPMNATAWLREGRLDIWVGTQAPMQARKEGALLTGLEEEAVHIHVPYLGGGFGRRAEMDVLRQAVRVAQAVPGRPVKLTWSREEDMSHDFYRPLAIGRFRALVRNGLPTAFEARLAAPPVFAEQMGRIGWDSPGPDASIVQATWDQPYYIPNHRVIGFRAPSLLPIGSWRAVGASQNGFFHESMMDEIAHAAEIDPLNLRLRTVIHPPSRGVLLRVAEMTRWGFDVPEGEAYGLAFVLSFGVPVAMVARLARDGDAVRILKIYAVADVGTALDPRNVHAQIESGIVFGLSAAIWGKMSLFEGTVQEQNFDAYRLMRMRDMPEIEIDILEQGTKVRGVGEPGVPPVAPALGNAIFALTGKRIRRLPFSREITFL